MTATTVRTEATVTGNRDDGDSNDESSKCRHPVCSGCVHPRYHPSSLPEDPADRPRVGPDESESEPGGGKGPRICNPGKDTCSPADELLRVLSPWLLWQGDHPQLYYLLSLRNLACLHVGEPLVRLLKTWLGGSV